MTRAARVTLPALTLLTLVLSAANAFAQGATVGAYQLVSQRRITLTVTEFTYRATLTNGGAGIQSATATVTSTSPNTVVVDNALAFGAIGAGGSGVSSDTFSIRQNRAAAFNPANLVWSVSLVPVGGGGGSLRVQPVANVRAGNLFSVFVQALDGSSNVDASFNGTVTLNAATAGGSNFVGGTQSASAVAGVATFTVALNNAADAYTVTAGSPGLTDGVSNAFNVTFTTLSVLPVANVRAGDPFNAQVEARDADGSLAENFGAGNALSLINLQAAVIASGQVAFNAAVAPTFNNGTATFAGLAINNAANAYTFGAQASSSGGAVVDAINAGFDVTARHVSVPGVMANHRAGTVFSLTVEARDANNVLAENFAGTLNLDAAAVGGSNFTGGTKTVAAAGGSATFNSLSLNNAADNYAITGSAAGLISGLGNAFNVTFTTLSVLPVANVRAGDPFNAQVEARDADGSLAENFGAGNALSLVNLQAAVIASGQTAFNAVVVPTFGGGTATFAGLSINNAANAYTFSAQASSSGGAVVDAINAGFDVTARHVNVPGVMANHRAGTVFSLTVEARDANNVLAENFAGTLNLDAATAGGSNFTGGTKTVAAAGGSATFNSLSLNNAADNYTITGSAAGLISGVGNTFNVTFTTLSVLPVANVRAGDPFNAQVEARDADGSLAENFGAGNALSLINLQAAVIASGQVAFNAAVAPTFNNGTATFAGLAINNAANAYTFSAQATSSGGAVVDAINAGFDVTARQVSVPGVMANHRAGTVFSLSVEARDANNVLAENFAGTLNLDAAAVGGSNFTGGTKTVAAAGGSATFNNLSLNNAANNYAITGSAAGLGSGVGNTFNVTFTALRILPVANVRAGDPFNVQVEALDANGALAENFESGAALSLLNLQAAVVASGQTAFNAVVVPTFGGGTATFTGLAINNAANGYTFSAATSSGGVVVDAIDAAFNVTARAVFVPPIFANHKAGTQLTFSVEARDANNVLAENFTGNINLDAGAAGGSNFTGGTKTVAAAGGSAAFNNLTLNNAANSYTITGSAAGLVSGVGNTFNVTFTALRVLAVASLRAGDPFNVQVEALDGNNALAENFDAGAGLTLFNLQAAVVASGQTAFNAAVAPTFGGGTATFANLSINNAANGYTFSAFAGAVSDAIDAPFNVTARVVFVPAVMANHEAGTVFSLTVEARDANNALAENFAGNINLDASAVGGSNFTGGTKTVAALAGAATFNNLSIGTAANDYVITGSAAGLISGVGNSFNVTGGGGANEAESLELSLSQAAIGAGGTINIGALVRDGLGDPIVPAPNVNYSILSDEGSSGPLPTVLNGQILTAATTRGGYLLHGQVDGTSVADDVFFAITPNAAQSAIAGKFANLAAAEGTVASKLSELAAAFESGNLAAIPAIKTAMQNAVATVPLTGRNSIQRSPVVAPETGFLPSSAQLTSAGFPVTAADTAFGTVIGNIVTKLNQIKSFYDTLPTNPATGGTDSVATLNQLNTDLAALQAQLEALDITPQAVVLHATKINNLIRSTMPLQMTSVVGKINGVLTANALASHEAMPSEFFDGSTPAATSLALVSPDAFYAQNQPAFFGFLGLFAGSSLQMNLVNRIYGPVMAQVSRMIVIMAANGILQNYLNVAVMDTIITGGSLSFHAPNIPGSTVEGSGINRENVASNEVFLIGGNAVAAVEGLIDAFNPSNIQSFDDLGEFFQGIVDALGGAADAYAKAEHPPDQVVPFCTLDGSPSCSSLVFNAGFENVSSCSGIFCFDFTVLVLYHNKDTGMWSSGVFAFFD